MHLRLADEAATRRAGAALAAALAPGAVLHLSGDLGAGKTTLVAGLLAALGHPGPVRSPTYTLVEPYEAGGLRLLHLDLYRLADAEELEFLGIRDLADGRAVLLVEWPQRGAGHLPAPDLVLRLAHRAQGRDLVAEAQTPLGERLVAALVQAAAAES
ncbi:tRNA (adenosine(37)-N6)-threonylcarbamoyltransferase complex ATPase subunit type 1 TsaE [Inmirania thermothiophila]|uniref:tRNA (adenosine(37)-N6)-threonylcarbamoyltransferase complex ATPase subunit type 1 TsaE n=1 Tax=Inmirania thermothiophila TaxID=1750597 RepID=UPI000F489715|nr:tRNA (adenosine(37)-N6)-threonylcarbamoyltransferase complex ATPase subunit type 1 TsaE [Inmirania thermothiophila]